MVASYSTTVETAGGGEILDLTPQVREFVRRSGVQEGTASLFVPGSTAGLTTLEYEPGVVRDLQDCFERLVPQEFPYAHEQAWHDGNGHSHVRAALLGPSLVLPVRSGRPLLGSWQQVVLVDFDNRARAREWTVTVMGD